MPSINQPQAKHWCFTLNNYTEENLATLNSLERSVTYLIYGKEVSETDTPHLQGFVSFPSKKRLNQVIALLGQCHCSVTRSVKHSIEYCKKDGDFTEIGTPSVKESGKRNDLQEFMKAVKAGETDHKVLIEKHASVYARYRKFTCEYVKNHLPVFEPVAHPLRPWQQELNNIITGATNDREIIFVVDLDGGKGKSWFARYATSHRPNTQLLLPGKKADMAYALISNKRIYFLDCPRSKQGDFIQYDFLEEVKNGLVFSSKYESELKSFAPPHVVVFMNERPDMSKLSIDRYKIINLD